MTSATLAQGNYHVDKFEAKHLAQKAEYELKIASRIFQTRETQIIYLNSILQDSFKKILNHIEPDHELRSELEEFYSLLKKYSLQEQLHNTGELELYQVTEEVSEILYGEKSIDDSKYYQGVDRTKGAVKFLKGILHETRFIMRRHGYGLALTFIALDVLQHVVPSLLSGASEALKAAIHTIPFPVAITAGVFGVKKIIDNKKKAKGYNGRYFFKKYKKASKLVKKKYKLKNAKYYLAPIDPITYVSIGKVPFYMKPFMHKPISLRKFKKLYKHSGINSSTIDRVLKLKGLKRHHKLYFSLKALAADPDQAARDILDEVKSFEVDSIHSRYAKSDGELIEWAYQGMEIHKLSEIKSWLDSMPVENQDQGIIIDIINELLISHWCEEINKTKVKHFRRFVKPWDRFYLASGRRRLSPVDEEFQEKLYKVFSSTY